MLRVRCTSKTKPKTFIIKSEKANVVVARKKVNKHTGDDTVERLLQRLTVTTSDGTQKLGLDSEQR